MINTQDLFRLDTGSELTLKTAKPHQWTKIRVKSTVPVYFMSGLQLNQNELLLFSMVEKPFMYKLRINNQSEKVELEAQEHAVNLYPV